MEPEPESVGMKRPAQHHFRLGVLAPHGSHHPRSGRSIDGVGHLSCASSL
jgi:hypothetical protein